MESFLQAGNLQRLHLFLNSLPENYRPILVLSIFSKLLKKAAQQALKYYFETFIFWHSTKTALIYFCDSICKQINNAKLTGAVYVDLSKAFGTIGHSVLLQNVSTSGAKERELE